MKTRIEAEIREVPQRARLAPLSFRMKPLHAPFSLRPDPAPEKTKADLEWSRLLEAVAERCAGPMGRAHASSLPFAESREEARTRLAESREAAELHRDGEPLPVLDVPDVGPALERIRVGGVLGPVELREIASMLGSARVLRRFLHTRRDQRPALWASLVTDPMLDRVADELASAFDPDGSLSDRASPRLRELRSDYRNARQRMLSRLDDLMQRYEGILQDRYVTEREGRYVVPVRSDAHERFPGIVHATSGSGATLFVEPRAVIPLGNRLKVLESEVQREEQAVYARLTGLVADVLPSTEAAASAIARADVLAAIAKLAHELSMSFPEISDEPVLDLRQARHPLLALDLPEVVPSDLSASPGGAVVISGPNAGGKTVALKTLGLAALMVRAGLPVACADGSKVGLFDVVLTDVGDDQSIQKNLSTFSAHVRNLTRILDETGPGALVLLDEIAGGTDPREGEALAAGVLDSLCARGGAVVATTHYEGLKALALGDSRFQNASCGFDIATMTPTFRLTMGIPGASSALAVARQYGMPKTVLDRAERFLSHGHQGFEEVVQKLQHERAALELARQAAEAREREVAAVRDELQAELDRARAREKVLLSREGEELLARLRKAKDELANAQSKLRGKRPDPNELKQAARAIDRVAGDVALGGSLEPVVSKRAADPLPPPLAPDRIRKGEKVHVPRLRAEAEIVEILGNGQVRVAAGPLKLTVSVADLLSPRSPTAKAAQPAPKHRQPKGALRLEDSAEPELAIQTADNSCDLRGLRADDAISMATSFLDRSLSDGRRVAFLIHGHGTGALREAIREELKHHAYVSHFGPADPKEGGDGVTVVWLA